MLQGSLHVYSLLCKQTESIGECVDDVPLTAIKSFRSNTSRDRFRRSLIGHYLTGDARQVSKFYKSALNMQGKVVTFEESEGGGPCGVWVEKDGASVVVT